MTNCRGVIVYMLECPRRDPKCAQLFVNADDIQLHVYTFQSSGFDFKANQTDRAKGFNQSAL